MADWIKHIKNESKTAWCGADITMTFAFENLEHAQLTMQQEGRLVPCAKCLKKATAAADTKEQP
jgi:hypothetical protein